MRRNPGLLASPKSEVYAIVLLLFPTTSYFRMVDPGAIHFDVVQWLGRVLFGIAAAMGVFQY
jgi:hypothetical protein